MCIAFDLQLRIDKQACIYWLRQLSTAEALLLVMFVVVYVVAVVPVRSPPLIKDIKTRMGGRV